MLKQHLSRSDIVEAKIYLQAYLSANISLVHAIFSIYLHKFLKINLFFIIEFTTQTTVAKERSLKQREVEGFAG